MTELSNQAPNRGRGRPALVHDNRRVQNFLLNFDSLSDLSEVHPAMGDIFAGVGMAVSEGDTAQYGICRSRIYNLLTGCTVISTSTFSEALAYAKYSAATIKRYTLAARTASVHIARELGRADLD